MVSRNWPEWSGTLHKRSGGWNNTTFFVENKTRRAVLRIYDTHKDKDKILFEHAVLGQLAALDLPFRVPAPVRAADGNIVVELPEKDGKFACLFQYIEGDSPGDEEAGFFGSFGEAAGILSAVLAEVNPGQVPVYRPYYELRQSYPLCSPEAVRGICLNPPQPFKDLEQELALLYEAYEHIAGSLEQLAGLPHQLVHGDLNGSNLLVHSSDRRQVAALLDFEFCTRDVRAMEPAVILSGLVGHAEEQAAVQEFWRGFSGVIRLSGAEIEAIPVLMLLRKADVFLHFVSRYLEGTDEADVLREQTGLLAGDLRQLSASTAQMMDIICSE
nr:phosphotransferase [Paenibacillus sp. PK3_47]